MSSASLVAQWPLDASAAAAGGGGEGSLPSSAMLATQYHLFPYQLACHPGGHEGAGGAGALPAAAGMKAGAGMQAVAGMQAGALSSLHPALSSVHPAVQHHPLLHTMNGVHTHTHTHAHTHGPVQWHGAAGDGGAVWWNSNLGAQPGYAQFYSAMHTANVPSSSAASAAGNADTPLAGTQARGGGGGIMNAQLQGKEGKALSKAKAKKQDKGKLGKDHHAQGKQEKKRKLELPACDSCKRAKVDVLELESSSICLVSIIEN